MGKSKTKTVNFTKKGIEKLPDDVSAVYKILTTGNKNNYTGVAKRGRLKARLNEHLQGGPDPVPGAKVNILRMPSISKAKETEKNIIARSKPKYNKKGK